MHQRACEWRKINYNNKNNNNRAEHITQNVEQFKGFDCRLKKCALVFFLGVEFYSYSLDANVTK